MSERPFAAEDFPALAAFLAADEERLLGRPSRVGASDLAAWVAGVDLDRHSLAVEEDGEVRALAWVEPNGPVGVGVVAADSDRIRERLVGWTESLLGEEPVERIHQVALAADDDLNRLLAARGYREVRRFWGMAIELDGAVPEPELPDGARIEALGEESPRAFHDALEEAFEDHWEHHPLGFEEWWERHRSSPAFDPTLWFLIRDGDEVAAAARNEANRNGGGYVGALGVRRPWRGRGYAKALLLHTFREFRERGMPRVTLGVDAESPTGATRLYESVGMYVEDEQIVWEKAAA